MHDRGYHATDCSVSRLVSPPCGGEVRPAPRELLWGAVLLNACDERQAGELEHSVRDQVRQRLYGTACAHAECNDAARLAGDPIQKLLIGRAPLRGAALASQPTLLRFRERTAAGTSRRRS
ncbi:MAG: transposase [Steroidobacteraceae bacterium]